MGIRREEVTGYFLGGIGTGPLRGVLQPSTGAVIIQIGEPISEEVARDQQGVVKTDVITSRIPSRKGSDNNRAVRSPVCSQNRDAIGQQTTTSRWVRSQTNLTRSRNQPIQESFSPWNPIPIQIVPGGTKGRTVYLGYPGVKLSQVVLT